MAAEQIKESAMDSFLKLIASDKDFADKHYYVLTWLGELNEQPNGTNTSWYGFSLEKNDESLSNSRFRIRGKTSPLPRSYRWFRRNGDVWSVLILTTGLPLLSTLYLLGFRDPVPYAIAAWPLALLVVAAITVVYHIWLGTRLEHKYSREFEQVLRDIDSAITREVVKGL